MEAVEQKATKEKRIKIVQNNVSRPKPGTVTSCVWDFADTKSAELGMPVPRKDVINHCMSQGINTTTIATQYSKWRKFHGLVREIMSKNQYGVAPAKDGTTTAQIWAIADTKSAELGAPVPRKVVMDICLAQGMNVSTIATQFAKWRKFHGLVREIIARNEQGISRPRSGTITGQIWDFADQKSAELGMPVRRFDVMNFGVEKGINATTVATQYAKWRKFHGLVREAMPKNEHGLARPKVGTITDRVWTIADSKSAELGMPVSRKDVMDICTQQGMKAATVATQYARWKKFHGLVREKAPVETTTFPSVTLEQMLSN